MCRFSCFLLLNSGISGKHDHTSLSCVDSGDLSSGPHVHLSTRTLQVVPFLHSWVYFSWQQSLNQKKILKATSFPLHHLLHLICSLTRSHSGSLLLSLSSPLWSLKQLGGHWWTEIKDIWNPTKGQDQPGPQLSYAAVTNDSKHKWINKNVLSPRSKDWKSKSHQAKNVLLDDTESVADLLQLLETTIIYWLPCGYIPTSIVACPFPLFSVPHLFPLLTTMCAHNYI